MSHRHTLRETLAKRMEARTAFHRGAANDLRRHGLVVDGGRTRGNEEVRILTAAGLAAAGLDLDREPEEMGACPGVSSRRTGNPGENDHGHELSAAVSGRGRGTSPVWRAAKSAWACSTASGLSVDLAMPWQGIWAWPW
ncbi:hypothetical protein AB0C61_29115 [Streptomyces sp. NPDC048680]|uniref:hypothetical protein n=1 Tax=Streptomyces sp. NPDC048680 TaxID=3155492 RepID=UPI00342C50DA